MEMEQEIESLFENVTERPILDHNKTSAYFFRYLQMLVFIVGLLLSALIVFVVLRSKQMRTRTNLIFANRCIYDILYMGTEFFYFFVDYLFGEALYTHNITTCFLVHTIGLFQMAMLGFTLILVSNKLINTEELSTKTLLIFGNSTVLVYYIAQVVQCVHECNSRHFVEGIVSLALAVLLILATLIKDVNRCRRNANVPISKDSNFRLNIARMLTYNWSLCFVMGTMARQYWMWRLTEVCMSLNAIYTFVYVFFSDETYKTRILKVLNFDFDFDDEDSMMEDGMYTKTRRESRNILVDFKRLDDVDDS